MVSGLGALSANAGAVEPRLEWKFETGGKIYASPLIGNIDADPRMEVIIAASRDKRILCLDDTGEFKWDYRIEDGDNDGIQATPSMADFDGDGMKEIVFASHTGVLGSLDAEGRLVWRTFLEDRVDYTGPVLADLDGNGRLEIVIGSDSGTVYCLDDCGKIRWRFRGEGKIRSLPAVLQDVTSMTTRVFVVFGGGMEACLGSDGTVMWSHVEPSPRSERWSTPALGDVDADSAIEVITATEDFQVICRDALTGAEEWRWAGNSKIDQTNSFALAYFDQPNRLDVVCADGTGQGGTGHVHLLRDGKPLWSVDVGGGVVQGPSVGDVDGDGENEILVCSRSKRLLCLNWRDGSVKWSFPSDTEVLTTPALGDVDGDGNVEIVFTSKDKNVYCLTVDGACNPQKLPWPMLSHDLQLSGNWWGIPFTPPAMATISPLPELYVGDFGPLHGGTSAVDIQITNNWYRPRHLEAIIALKLPNGPLINRTISQRFEPQGAVSFPFEFPVLYSGTYALWANLSDVGQARTLATEERSADLSLNELLTVEQGRTTLGGPEIVKMLAESPVKTALDTAIAPLWQDYLETLEKAKSVIGGTEATLPQRREAVAALDASIKKLADLYSRAHALVRTLSQGAEFAVVPETTLNKVYRDESLLPPYIAGPPKRDPLAISLCRNEYESAQAVIVPLLKDLKNTNVSLSGDLVHADGQAAIPRDHVAIYQVGYVETAPPEYSWKAEKQGFCPDVLLPNAPMDIPADQDAQPFFVTVRAGSDTKPGDYTGTLRVETEGIPAVELPVQVHVWDFAIPDKPSFKVSMWMNEGQIARFYKFQGRTPFDVRKRFYQMHLDHRISPVKDFPLGGGDLIEDFDFLMANGQNCFFIGLPGWLEESERPAFAQQLQDTRTLLQQKGWDSKAMFYSLDEVAVMQRPMIPKMVELNNWVKTIIPEWPRLETSAPESALFGAVDIWCPTIDVFDPLVLSQRMRQGDRLWFYTVWGRPGVMIDEPALDHRLMFWACAKYGAEGFLYWGTTHWGYNCDGEERWPARPWLPFNSQAGHNGCGYLIYPGPDAQPLASVRLSIIRDGIEDYEYLHLLRQLAEKVKDTAPPELYAQAVAEAGVSPAVLVDHKTFTDEPDRLFEVRKTIAELIEKLQALAAGKP